MIYRLFLMLTLFVTTASAQDFSGLARLDVAQSGISDTRAGVTIDLHLSQPVPYRVFTMDNPRRLVLDFREVDWNGASRQGLLNSDHIETLHFGNLRPGWSRMVLELQAPMKVVEAGMRVAETTGFAQLSVVLAPSNATSFAEATGAPKTSLWDQLYNATRPAPQPIDGPLVIAIDAGHGGIDPGAEYEGVKEADLMNTLAIELAEALNRSGQIRAFLTREGDTFVSLEDRMTLARAAGAAALISLHADALEIGSARGASVYTLTAEAQNTASDRMVQRHERGDLVAGLDLQGQDDRVAGVLMDLARLETGPASDRLAEALVTAMDQSGVRLHPRPRREARLAVLNAPDFASVLIEVGFLSNAEDRAMLQTRSARAKLVAGIRDGLIAWAIAQEVAAPLIRQ